MEDIKKNQIELLEVKYIYIYIHTHTMCMEYINIWKYMWWIYMKYNEIYVMKNSINETAN